MAERKEDIKRYLQNEVNPVLKPLVEEITQARPPNILQFILQYAQRQLNKQNSPIDNTKEGAGQELKRMGSHPSSEEEISKEQEEQLARKIQDKIKGRSKKNSRKGISAEVFGDYNQKAAFTPQQHPKSKESAELIRGLLKKSIMFQSLSEDNMAVVVGAMEEVKCPPEKEIIREGDAGDKLYVIASGQYECTKIINGKPTYLKTYKTGQLFGELSLMYNAKRAASIRCTKSGTIFALDRLTFMNIVQESAIRKRTEYEKVIGRIEILQDVQDYEKQQLCDALKEEIFAPNEYVVKEGEDGDRLYFVIEGNLVAEKFNRKANKQDVVFKYKEKEYFGEIALMKNTVRQASVRAVTKCKLLSIGREEFKRLLGPLENILQRNMDKYKKFLNKA